VTRTVVSVVESALKANDQLAAQNRARLDAAGAFALNVMASPRAGRTSLSLRTLDGRRASPPCPSRARPAGVSERTDWIESRCRTTRVTHA
jgi:hypothetical protein